MIGLYTFDRFYSHRVGEINKIWLLENQATLYLKHPIFWS